MEDQDKDKLSCTTLTALCVSLKIQVSGILFNNLEAAAHPLPTVPSTLPACLLVLVMFGIILILGWIVRHR